MDAVKFIEERRRMNRHNAGRYAVLFGGMDAAELVKETEEWSAAHPRKTRQSVFLEHYPDAARDKDNLLKACPNCLDANVSCVIDKNATVKKLKRCDACRREFWMQEVE